MNVKEVLLSRAQLKTVLRGLLNVNIWLLPLSLFLFLFLSVMAGGSPNSPGAATSFGIVALYVYGFPIAITAVHIIGAKVFDSLFRIVPPALPEISWLGISVAAFAFVVWANIYVDHLFQFHRGDYQISIGALVACILGMRLLAWAGERPVPNLVRWLKNK